MLRTRQVVVVLAAVCLAVVAVGCTSGTTDLRTGTSSCAPSAPESLSMTHVFLRPERPTHVTLHVAAGRLQVTMNATAPLESWRLQKVSPPSSGSRPLAGGTVVLSGRGRSHLGLRMYVLRTAMPLDAGWYRIELVGRTEIVQLCVESR